MAAEQKRDRAGESAHADDRGGLEVAIDLAAFAPTAEERHAEFENARREKAGPADSGQRVRLLFLRALERNGVDLLGRDEQQRVVAALTQLLRDGQSREEMAACTPRMLWQFSSAWFRMTTFAHYTTSASAQAPAGCGKCPVDAC